MWVPYCKGAYCFFLSLLREVLWIATKLLQYCHYAIPKSGKAAVAPI